MATVFEKSMELDVRHWSFVPLLMGFIFSAYRATCSNSPTFSETSERQSLAEAAAARRDNLQQRVVTAGIYVPFVTGMCVYQPGMMGLFVVLMIHLALGEFVQILAPFRHGDKRPKALDDYRQHWSDRALVGVGTAVGLSAFIWDGVYFSSTFTTCFYGLIVFHLATVQFHVEQLSLAIVHALALHALALLLIAYCWAHIILLVRAGTPYCGGLVAMMCLASWASDAAGYFIGKRLGRTPLFPQISPSKTLEGTVACVVFAVLPCVGLQQAANAGWLPEHALPRDAALSVFVSFGLLIGVAGVFGGLISSLLKRAGGVKDSGRFFSGHGGVNDRFDTFSLCGPLTYFFAVLLQSWWRV
jgi:phosphatidate cytidylyltransferase